MTLNGYHNYGNRLQNFALQEVLKSLGLSVETLIIDNPEMGSTGHSCILRKLGGLRGKSTNELVAFTKKKVINMVRNKRYANSIKTRTGKFRDFSKKHIKETVFTIATDNIVEVKDEYDYFVVGSDQVWNPYYTKGSQVYFLSFAPQHKRISYAASFGISRIPDEYCDVYKNGMLGMQSLSVREDVGAKIIKELIGADVPVHVDPTLLLTREMWLSISTEAPNKPKAPYMLTYFLDGVPNQYRKIVQHLGNAELETINLGDITEKDTFETGPGEFIDYINDCELFCTNSFHGAVFAILLNKPFVVFERAGYSMFSRLSTLLKKFNLESREAGRIAPGADVFDIDLSPVPSILETERERAFTYLRESLDIKNEDHIMAKHSQ